MSPRPSSGGAKGPSKKTASVGNPANNPSSFGANINDDTPFHPDILRLILGFCDRHTVVNCLRVSLQFQDLAGDFLYTSIKLDGDYHHGDARYSSRVEAVLSGYSGKMLNSDKKKVAVARTFKLPLLAKVQVVTIGSHSKSHCNPLAAKIQEILPSLSTLRLCPTRFPVSAKTVLPICSNEDGYQLIKRLEPEYLVYRRIGINGLPIPSFMDYDPPRLKMVTYIFAAELPILGPDDDNLSLLGDLAINHSKVKHVSIVFIENEILPLNLPEDVLQHLGVAEVNYDNANEVLFDILRSTISRLDVRYEVCGGEVLGHGAAGSQGKNRVQDVVDRIIRNFKDIQPDYDEGTITFMSRAEWMATKRAKWELGMNKVWEEEEV